MKSEGGIITEWYNIGLELLDSDSGTLNVIRKNYPSDNETCCTEMFNKWLQVNSDASWHQLTEALANVGLNTAAKNIIEGQCDRTLCIFLNQVLMQLAHAWFLRIASVRECLYTCLFA